MEYLCNDDIEREGVKIPKGYTVTAVAIEPDKYSNEASIFLKYNIYIEPIFP